MKKLFLLIFFFLFLSCQQRANLESLPYSEEEKMKIFSFSRSDELGEWKISGKIARISPDRKKTSITKPRFEIKTEKGKILTLQTAEDGVAEFTIDETTRRINSLTATKNVVIIQRDEKGELLFKSTSEKMVYDGKKRVIVLTGNPVVQQGKNELRGKIIRFFIDTGKIIVTGNVRGIIFQEETNE